MEVAGKIKLVNDVQTFDSGFQKREFVVTTEEQYPQDIKLELIKDKCNLIDAFQPGDDVVVQFNLRGNEYNGRYFVNLQAWRLEKGTAQPAAGAPAAGNAAAPPLPSTADMPDSSGEEDDLPF